jgi:hypothetical protein
MSESKSVRYARLLLIPLAMVAVLVLRPAPAAAETLSASGKIYITAIVAPQHYVIIDNSGTITQIDSNTTEDTVPLVYLSKVLKGNERPLTPEIMERYQQLVPPGSSHVGTLYKAKPLSPIANPPKKAILDYSIAGFLLPVRRTPF